MSCQEPLHLRVITKNYCNAKVTSSQVGKTGRNSQDSNSSQAIPCIAHKEAARTCTSQTLCQKQQSDQDWMPVGLDDQRQVLQPAILRLRKN